MRSSVIVIRSAYFGAQKRRKYAKNVGVSRSEIAVSGVLKQYWQWVSESKTENKPKKQEKLAQARLYCLFAFSWVPNTKT